MCKKTNKNNQNLSSNMKSVSTLKSANTDSPKTPGGISRALLTPCRRVGLSRNWKKSGASPFQSPLTTPDVKEEKAETRKRKESLEDTSGNDESHKQIALTPTRNVDLPRRKKSKTLLASINKSIEENEPLTQKEGKDNVETRNTEDKVVDNDIIQSVAKNLSTVSTPLRLKSKSRIKKKITTSETIRDCTDKNYIEKENLQNKDESSAINKIDNKEKIKENNPNNLTKECIVVIQKKIFKKELHDEENVEKSKNNLPKQNNTGTNSQTLFDSDSDDIPLNKISKIETVTNVEDDDFEETNKPKTKKQITKAKEKSPKSSKIKNAPKIVTPPIASQMSMDDDDDFVDKKRTILVRKSYDKLPKPQKAKSTGSITQRDIDELKARIERKKKLLLAQAMTEDTKELRELIKKWQKGCQDALSELMDLMKMKFPDKQNMDYSEILQTLKIPASLVGYDSENECFLTPDDESIILAKIKN